MVEIVSYIKENPSSTKRLIGLKEEQLNILIDKAQQYEQKKKKKSLKQKLD